ncbi:hypothetical protein ACHAWF_009487 [Thalassiosira exigua]
MKLSNCLLALSGVFSSSSASAFVVPNIHTSYGALYATDASVTEVENPRLSGLALMLDDGTRKSHSMAQNTSFVTGFFKGLANRESYKALVTSLFFVYENMEAAMDATSEGGVRALDYPELRRLSPLKKDMEFFYGSNWKAEALPSPAAKAYVARVLNVAESKPYLLVAHQYTRYLGDLFGGQMMGGMASRSLSLQNGDGTAFYTFEDISSTNDFITEWYHCLNQLELTDSQKEEIVDEANLVFDLNIDLLQELEGSPLKAMLTLTIKSLKEKLGFA